MVAQIREFIESRRGSENENASENNRDLRYKVWGTDDENEAITLTAATSPLIHNGMARRGIEFEELGGGVWDTSARYANRDTEPAGTSFFEFETGGGTQHIIHSLQTINRYPGGAGGAPNCFGLIGCTNDSVEGCDIVVPVFQFSERKIMRASIVTDAYVDALYALTGKTNDASFRRKAAGEVLFLGAQGSKRGYDDWEISFKFAASPNRTGLSIGGITGIDKKGWEYLWVMYEDSPDATAKKLGKKVIGVYVEQVYLSGSFGIIGT